jgi:hypothetical protein
MVTMAMAQPLLLEIEQARWSEWIDRVEPWLKTTATFQSTFRKMLEDTVDGISEPHLRKYFDAILEAARDHEGKVDDLYRAFGRAPAGAGLRSAASTLVSKTREAVGHAEGLAAGARGGSWRKLRELLLTNLDAISGFAVTEQLALALGVPAAVEIVLPILKQKTEHQLLMRETLLEMAPKAILYQKDM